MPDYGGLGIDFNPHLGGGQVLALQNDGVSCGAFSLAYAIFLIRHGRVPLTTDFDGDNHIALRLAVLNFFVKP